VAAAGELGAADGVDRAVDAVEPATGGPVLNGSCTEAELPQLAEANHPVLPIRQNRDFDIDRKLNTKATTCVANVLSLILHRYGSVPGGRRRRC
jgi:hypothetical protein